MCLIAQGKRDHESYYKYEAAANWIARRLPAVANDNLKQQLQSALDGVRAAQKELDDGAQMFLQGQNKLRELQEDWKTNGPEMVRIADEMAKSQEGNLMVDNARKLQTQVNAIQANLSG